MECPDFQTITWDESHNRLKTTLGCHPIDLAKLSYSGNNVTEYCHQIAEWQELYDIELLNIILPNHYIVDSVYVVSDISFIRDIGVFNLTSQNIHGFVNGYFEQYGECLFDGDVFLILPEDKKMVVFQHDGYHMAYSLPLLPF